MFLSEKVQTSHRTENVQLGPSCLSKANNSPARSSGSLCAACPAPASQPQSEQMRSTGQALPRLGGHRCLDFPVSVTLFFLLVMLVQRPKETEVLGGNDSGNLYRDAGGSVTQSARGAAPQRPGGGDKIV